jgi:hypothetical protein
VPTQVLVLVPTQVLASPLAQDPKRVRVRVTAPSQASRQKTVQEQALRQE